MSAFVLLHQSPTGLTSIEGRKEGDGVFLSAETEFRCHVLSQGLTSENGQFTLPTLR